MHKQFDLKALLFSVVIILMSTCSSNSASTIASEGVTQSEMTIAYLVPAYGKMKFLSPEGNVIQELTIGNAPSFCDWSVENEKLAFVDIWDDSLYMMNLDGTELVKITEGGRELSWSPGGDRIAFDTNTPDNNAPFSGRGSEIYLVDVNNLNSVRLVAGMSPDWSPVGDTIAYVSMLTSGGFPHIFTTSIDGTNSLQLTDGFTENYNPRWSPDGEKIAFISTRDYPNGGGREVYTMNADGANVTQLTHHTEMKGIQPLDLEWSPSGNQIAVLAKGLSMDFFLYIIEIDDSDMRSVASETSMRCPVWIPLPASR
jgi:Tol biopolymer transport system component